ncbi:MAG TPA: hypothetical protein ENJ95_16015, partial [Bacteroidetes bacterium]|nr:hypothetical protein [Bacteroidota bacterium]
MKQFFTLFLCVFLLQVQQVLGQCSGSITLATQADVDAFDCVDFSGSITVQGNDITNLDSLSELETLTESLKINGTGNLGVISFPNLKDVGDRLDIRGNAALTGLSFPVLGKVGSGGFASGPSLSLRIQNNASLEAIPGFDSLRTVGNFLSVANNAALREISG